jgi:hypothetical protein
VKVLVSAVVAILLVCPSRSWAQDAPLSQEQLDERYDELVLWLKKYRQWEDWIAVNGNRPAQNMLGGVDSHRRERPEPPAWLSDDCERLIGHDGKLGQACEILRSWHGLAPHLEQVRRDPAVTTSGGVVNDRVVKSSFWRRVHLTGLWAPGQVPPPPMFGVVGMQMGVVEIGRVTFPALGAMLVTLTGDNGKREWKPATNISVSFRLRNFELDEHTAVLHFNVSRLNIHAAGSLGPTDLPLNLNFVGLSLSFRKRN